MTNKGAILIVEDNQFNLDMARDLLEEAGFVTLEAVDADRGIALAKAHKPDLILMDIHMPARNGYEAARVIKMDPETQHIPIVAFTALAMGDDEARARSNGCCGVISKPIDVVRFAEMVGAYIGQDAFRLDDVPPASMDRELSELLMKLSHDIQAPVRKIVRFSEFLRQSAEEKLSPDEREFLNGIERASQQLQGILVDTMASLNDRVNSVRN